MDGRGIALEFLFACILTQFFETASKAFSPVFASDIGSVCREPAHFLCARDRVQSPLLSPRSYNDVYVDDHFQMEMVVNVKRMRIRCKHVDDVSLHTYIHT